MSSSGIPPEDGYMIASVEAGPSDQIMDFGLERLFDETPADEYNEFVEYTSPHHEENILEDLGEMKTRATLMDKVAEYSDIQKCLHVKSGPNGLLTIHISCEDLPSSEENDEEFFIRLMLVRVNPLFTHLPVDRVCNIHSGTSKDLKNHVLRYSKEKNTYAANYVDGARPSIVFEVPPPRNGKIDIRLNIFFACNDSCVNSQTYSETTKNKCMPHKARDLRLMQTLEIRRNFKMEILRRCSTFLWIKANVTGPDLLRKERRGPQGGYAQKLKRENGEPESQKKKAKKIKKEGSPTSAGPSNRNKKKQTATTPPETVDHIDSILSLRVYNAEDQTAAFSEVIEEMGQRIIAYNEAGNKSLQ